MSVHKRDTFYTLYTYNFVPKSVSKELFFFFFFLFTQSENIIMFVRYSVNTNIGVTTTTEWKTATDNWTKGGGIKLE